jgi:hypothetical protein
MAGKLAKLSLRLTSVLADRRNNHTNRSMSAMALLRQQFVCTLPYRTPRRSTLLKCRRIISTNNPTEALSASEKSPAKSDLGRGQRENDTVTV